MQPKTTIVVVDDHPLYRLGVVQALQKSERFEVLGEGATAMDAARLVAAHKPDLLLLDLHLPGGGLEAVRAIRATPCETRIVVLSVEEDIKFVAQAFQIGVSGYLLKGISGSELIRTIEAAAAGEHCVAPTLLGHLLGHLSGAAATHAVDKQIRFAVREEQILGLLARGMSNKEIAFQAGISEKTAKYYLTNIMKKLHVRNRVEVALYAAQRTTDTAPDFLPA
ncbi:response regulator [Szabonella alba]|uniref:Response regulator transcription factor n=1 Tax=Szabonella alba TaxID=2804194 RepID=A0A8K0VGS5_9RHOB|nr:response regulator transcription factor [Szabonella alba]MBL4919379.1 response regulator transcription factor [Szabonella alba]